MELHRLLTFVAAVLLVVTLFLYYDQDAPGGDSVGNAGAGDISYAYATGIAMLAALVASFVIFTRQKMRRGFAS